MQDILSALFGDNPNLAEEINAFLNRQPRYVQAKQTEQEQYRALADTLTLQQKMLFLKYESAVNAAASMEIEGYYLFGLGLRRDLREALWQEQL